MGRILHNFVRVCLAPTLGWFPTELNQISDIKCHFLLSCVSLTVCALKITAQNTKYEISLKSIYKGCINQGLEGVNLFKQEISLHLKTVAGSLLAWFTKQSLLANASSECEGFGWVDGLGGGGETVLLHRVHKQHVLLQQLVICH